ncbi:hypothetical protein E1180_04420 [Roseibium denhamense]|uniref:Uncharacterized protein n=1 Tax=Roseibium denhamense TaxID=76305 RepID=A0ABY1PJU5_9HYPH|nr:hypothetical protein [Roseibium denhamense]MTI04757.1 hypothetical protein [Roseibium denhamense]SMP33469.1 hypothetical protein SAMN06265374_3747 [Roseibium denhamense]
MTPFWAAMAMPGWKQPTARQTRLRDLEARMGAFLVEKDVTRTSCPNVLNNIRNARSSVQQELTKGKSPNA